MLKGWKTLILNGVSAIVAVLVAFDWVSIGLTTEQAGLAVAAINVATMVLRAFTNTPVGKAQ